MSAGSASALLVVDMQVGVMAQCADADAVLARTQVLVMRARTAATTVIWVQDEQDFARHSADWQLAAPLEPAPGEARVFKAYRDAFAGTDLAAVLTDHAVGRLLVAGAQSDFCVRTAAQSAAAKGFDVVLIGDAHTTCDAVVGNAAIPAAHIVEHTNQYFAGLRYPGQHFAVASHDSVAL